MAHMYRADTVGSLLRPQYLKLAREQFEAGQLAAAAYKEIEDRAVDQAIAMQEALKSVFTIPSSFGEYSLIWNYRCGARMACGSMPALGWGSACTSAADSRGSACSRPCSALAATW